MIQNRINETEAEISKTESTGQTRAKRTLSHSRSVSDLRKEAYSKIDLLSEDSIRLIIAVMDRFDDGFLDKSRVATATPKSAKMQALARLEKMIKDIPAAEGFDYEKARREAMREKYESIT